MSFRLVTSDGDFLVDADGNYLVWSLGVPGRMSLAVSAPTITFTVGAPSITLTISEDD